MVAALAAGAALPACTAVRNDLGAANSPCYVALPAALQAVHANGRLIGVRLATVSSLARLRALYPVAHVIRQGQPVVKVCLVAFTGHYTSGSVEAPRGRPVGRLAVVVLEYQGNELLGTVIAAGVPLAFGHSHFGP